MIEQGTVVDLDLHLAPTKDDLEPYCALPWRMVLGEPGGVPPWTIGGGPLPYPGSLPAPAPAARDPRELARAMDELGADTALLLPGPLLKLGVLPTAAYAAALAEAYNRWLVERWLADERAYGATLVAPQDPAAAADQIAAHAANERIRAVVVPLVGIDPMLGDRRYDPIYDQAAAAGRPVIMHVGGGVGLPASPHLITQYYTSFEQLAMSAPLIATANLVSMVGSGVFARYPDLRVLFLGAGVSWYSHSLLRMDKEYNENRRDVAYYSDRLSTYLRRQVWVGIGPAELAAGADGLARLIRISAGEDRVVYGSGWPLPEFETPETLRDLAPDLRARVLAENARALLGL